MVRRHVSWRRMWQVTDVNSGRARGRAQPLARRHGKLAFNFARAKPGFDRSLEECLRTLSCTSTGLPRQNSGSPRHKRSPDAIATGR